MKVSWKDAASNRYEIFNPSKCCEIKRIEYYITLMYTL